MTFEGLAGTGLVGGRHLRAGAASRFLVVADLDACWVLAQRPDWESMAEWTPLTGWRGVQIWGCRADWTPVGGWRGVQILGGC